MLDGITRRRHPHNASSRDWPARLADWHGLRVGRTPPGICEFEPFLDNIAMGAFNFSGSDWKIGGDSLAVLELARSIDEVSVARTRSLVVGHSFCFNMHGEFRLDGSQLSRQSKNPIPRCV